MMKRILQGEHALQSHTFIQDAEATDQVSRRRLVAQVLGGLGAVALLGCDGESEGHENGAIERISSALGTTATIEVADTAANLRAVTGGTTSWVAVLQGFSAAADGGGGVFFWSATSKADDGWSVLNSGSGNSAGWRRVNPGVTSVTSVSALRALAGGSGRSTAILSGYTGAGDGGGGIFFWSTTAALDDGGTILNAGGIGTSAAGWRRLFSGAINVRWFGAVATGLVDAAGPFRDAVKAAAALTPVASVFVPAGTYLMDGAVSDPSSSTPANLVLKDGARISGEGSQSILIWKAKSALPMDPMLNDLILLNGSNITISDLTFRSTNGSSSGAGYVENDSAMQHAAIVGRFIYQQPNLMDNIEISRCRFENLFGFMAHSVDNDTRFRFVDNIARYCGNGCNICAHRSVFSGNFFLSSEGIETSGPFSRIENNYFEGITALVSITGYPSGAMTTNVIVTGNTFDLSGAVGGVSAIIASDSFELTISNNTILNAPAIGIYVLGNSRRSHRVAISGNIVSYDAGWHNVGVPAGIQLNNVEEASVVNNAIKGGFWGIELVNSSGVTVQGNSLSFQGNSGIAALSGSADISISGNDVHGASAAGLDLYGVIGAIVMGNRFKSNTQADIRTDTPCAGIRSVSNRYDTSVVANAGSFVYSAGDGP